MTNTSLTPEEEEINYYLLVTFALMSIPQIAESLVETGQELTMQALVTELNKINKKFQYDNVFIETFVQNLSSNTQSFAMVKIMAFFIALNGGIDGAHYVALKSWNFIKDLASNTTSLVTKGKIKINQNEDKQKRTESIQRAIALRQKNFDLSSNMTTAVVGSGALTTMAKTSKQNNVISSPQDVNKTLKWLATLSGFDTVPEV